MKRKIIKLTTDEQDVVELKQFDTTDISTIKNQYYQDISKGAPDTTKLIRWRIFIQESEYGINVIDIDFNYQFDSDGNCAYGSCIAYNKIIPPIIQSTIINEHKSVYIVDYEELDPTNLTFNNLLDKPLLGFDSSEIDHVIEDFIPSFSIYYYHYFDDIVTDLDRLMDNAKNNLEFYLI